jgi:hypothetical protein
MGVQVLHCLLGIYPCVEHGAETRPSNTFEFRHSGYRSQHQTKFRHLVIACRGKPGDVLSWYHQHVDRRLRLYIAKRHDMFILHDDVGWNLAKSNTAEETIGHHPVYGGSQIVGRSILHRQSGAKTSCYFEPDRDRMLTRTCKLHPEGQTTSIAGGHGPEANRSGLYRGQHPDWTSTCSAKRANHGSFGFRGGSRISIIDGPRKDSGGRPTSGLHGNDPLTGVRDHELRVEIF